MKLIAATLTAGTVAAGLLLAGTADGTATARPNTHVIEGTIVEAPASTAYDWPSGCGAGRYHHATGTITITITETNNDTGPSTAEWTLTLHR